MPYSGDQRMEIHVPWCSYEARDKFLIMFHTRPCDQDLIINGSQVFVQGSQLQERKSVRADSSKKWQHYWKFRIQARARSLGCTRDKKQNWKGKISVVSLAKSASLCHSLLLWVCGFLHGLGFHLIFVSSDYLQPKHSRTCPWNVKYQELLVSGYNILWITGLLTLLVESSLGQDSANNLLCYGQGSLYQSHDTVVHTVNKICHSGNSPGRQPTVLKLRKPPYGERAYHKDGGATDKEKLPLKMF